MTDAAASPASVPVSDGSESARIAHFAAEGCTARVVTAPLAMRVNDDFTNNLAFMRRGLLVAVVADRRTLWSKEVWQRGVWLRWRPGYDRRITRAKRKAQKIAEAMNV